ncbi:TPA: aldose 1-epimerase family protein [Clostridium perfringens]|uniref:Aldose 1-epimerase family protein n=1 Tax=Clostridium perfringens TaxID=1502 RepID=A0AAW9J2W3_CLOPF|nr:aldose 1-epimerase family protein [Clostridium perfringens]EJT6475441.1 aldose 1-epimerase family protein [Clostridium perfringens]EJT6481110.1 aldose 1-epimerase family protein [Clostridium perfringens]EJT6532559.1 aldose 1-epimerase family protein [Clostridium perfringens]MBI5989628.1 aldose 1-epimerase family protein [Clostridium perfringens]MBI6001090.1 aldose 1-epimerase family protein [Clostridium perfringens]
MIYTLENQHLKISLSNHGGELHSIKGKKDNTEFLWSGDEAYWKYHAPILFPIVGKVFNGKYTVDGKTYELPQHGLARVRDFEMIEQTKNSISFELKYSEDTLKVYPFKFSLIIKYTLNDINLSIDYIVKNLDNKEMYFSIGAHPAFMCPIENDKFDDYYFEFNEKENASIMQLVGPGYFSKEEKPYLKDENIINLSTDLFKNDALVFKNLKSNKISLKSKNHKKYLEFDFGEFPYLGLWTKDTGAPFVCIEPWFGHADFDGFNEEFKDKAAIQSLMPNKEFHCNYNISFFE